MDAAMRSLAVVLGDVAPAHCVLSLVSLVDDSLSLS